MNATETAVDALAVARLTRLAQQDDVWPMPEARQAFLRWADGGRIADLATCPYCGSWWIALGVAFLRWRFPRWWPWVSRALAASFVAGRLDQ